MAKAKAPVPANPAPQAPCKIAALPSGAFQIRAADMPVTCQVGTPNDGKSEISAAAVYPNPSAGATAVAGAVTNQTTTAFTLTLPVGSYIVLVALAALPSANPIWIVEACGGNTKLDWIAVPINTAPAGQFQLEVV